MSCKCIYGYFQNSLDFLLSFFTYSCGIRFLRCSRFRRFTGFNFGSRRTTMFLKKAGSLERTAFVNSSMQQINKNYGFFEIAQTPGSSFILFCFFTERYSKNIFSPATLSNLQKKLEHELNELQCLHSVFSLRTGAILISKL